VKVDRHDSWEAGSRKVVYYCTTFVHSFRVLLLFTGTAGMSFTDFVICKFLFFRGSGGIIYDNV
jgi:hypothetical protein